MRKKIIKSYSFNNLKNSPAVNATFCFSKRAIKQRRLLKRTTYKNANYQFLVDAYINYSFWQRNKHNTPNFVLKSYYFSKSIIDSLRLKKSFNIKTLYLWYVFKRRFTKATKVQTQNFPHTGVLSSHFVHFISKKNITYQTRSKYKAKQFNVGWARVYTQIYTHILYNYIASVNAQLYFFTQALDKRYISVDEDFTTSVSKWEQNYSVSKPNKFTRSCYVEYLNTSINVLDYNVSTFNKIKTLLSKTTNYLQETDSTKRESLYKDISESNVEDVLPILFTASQLIFSDLDKNSLHNVILLKVLLLHKMYVL